MDDGLCLDFFRQPTQPCHRRYEALRAVFIDGRPQKEVAEEFGFFLRSPCGNGCVNSAKVLRPPGRRVPLFQDLTVGRPTASAVPPEIARPTPEAPEVADRRELLLSST